MSAISETSPLLRGPGRSQGIRKRVSYCLTLLNCLFSASFTVFSLYSVFFEEQLGYTPLNVNYVSIAAEMGLYLCVPALGYLADASNLSYLGLIGSVTSAVGYAACAAVVRTRASYFFMALAFSVVGVSCSAIFISCLVHCARLYPGSATLAIAMPTTVYGISSILYAKVISAQLDDGVDVAELFGKLAVLLAVVGLLQAIAPVLGREGLRSTVAETPEEEENNIKKFFGDRKTLLCLLSFVLVSGPLEMYQNNVGLIAKTGGSGTRTATQVALFSVFSTASRLSVGALADLLHFRPPMILLSVLCMLAVTDALLAFRLIPLDIGSSLSGFGYGASFTLYPLMVSKAWGLQRFATYWGLFILGPAFGAFIFGMLFALDLQWVQGYSQALLACAAAFVASIYILHRLKFHEHW